jgi:hypothetical protein
MNKYLILKFRNAKLFRHNKDTKDKHIDVYNKTTKDRQKSDNFVDPLTLYQISNVIHALFGERPVPTMRDCKYPKNDYYFEKAKESYLDLDILYKTLKSGEEVLITEKTTIKKALWDSWNPSVYINWEIVKRYLKTNYEWFILEISKLTNNKFPLNISFDDTLKNLLYNKTNLDLLYVELENRKCSALKTLICNYINGVKHLGIITKEKNKIGICVVKGVDWVTLLKGTIIIPVDDKDIEILKNNSTGTCRILDGGVVTIHSIVESHEINLTKFRKVKDISLEKYENKIVV